MQIFNYYLKESRNKKYRFEIDQLTVLTTDPATGQITQRQSSLLTVRAVR